MKEDSERIAIASARLETITRQKGELRRRAVVMEDFRLDSDLL